MGTDYSVHDKDGTKIELAEMSNRFTLFVTSGAGTPLTDVTSYGHLTPDDVIKMGLEMLKVASYWTDSEEFAQSVAEWRKRHCAYEGTLLRTLGEVGHRE